MSIIGAARYKIGFNIETRENPAIDRFVEIVSGEDTINVIKKTKSGEKEINIRPLIYELSGNINGNTGEVEVLLGAGQTNNVRPELFLSGVSHVIGSELKLEYMHRLMLYVEFRGQKGVNLPGANKNAWISPLDEKIL